ncbi:MAG: ABC transporter ATP-binding protein [Gammaproteobacteria bacterium]|nr:MAG: ABC transporter ATP-binding protein [Gammaproteobacteria bacterium]
MALLETHKLTLAIAGRTLCTDLSVAFHEGENWALLGANGSGKTTLVHTLAGLRPADGGRVLLDAEDIHTYPPRLRAKRLGVLFQDYEAAFPTTVMETVLTGRHPHLDRWEWESDQDVQMAERALSAMGLTGFSQRPLTTLSGGERRRVEIATLLVQDAPLCLMDEPTNHLDLRHQAQVLRLLAERTNRPGNMNLFVLHDVNLAARYCSHGVLLFGGGDCIHGRLAEILNRTILERLYHCPLREIDAGDGRYYLPA